MKVLRGDELEKRARELGLDIEGDPRTHSSSGRAPRAADYELQRRVQEAEHSHRESRPWIFAIISVVASVLSAAAAIIAVSRQWGQDRSTWTDSVLAGSISTVFKKKHSGNLIVPGAGELARSLIAQDCVDEYWFWVHPYIWPSKPPIFDDLSAIPLELVATRTFASGVVQLCYRSSRAGTAPNQ